MTRPPMFPPPQFPPARLAPFQRMPPAVFPSILGLLGLGLALRLAAARLGLPGGLADLVLGAVTLLWVFAAAGYGAKVLRRAGVLGEDIAILPGQSGLAAMLLGGMMVAAALAPHAPGVAAVLTVLGLVLHAGLAVLLVRRLAAAGVTLQDVTPVWHLNFVGFIVGGVAAAVLGWTGFARAVLWLTLPVAVAIWAISLWQLSRRIPPAPLRPLLAIHLAPASLLGTVAAITGQAGLALGLAVFAAALLAVLVGSARWLLAAGFTPFWGAFTFPLAAFAGLMFHQGWLWPATLALIAALGIIPAIAFRVLKGWADGSLAARTNAATA